jgi:hypothetical protein
VPLEVVDVGSGEDPAEVAEALRMRYEERNFDYEHEWPVRLAVIREGGAPTHAVAVYLHLAVDAMGMTALLADLAGRDPRTGAAPGPLTALQPLAQARLQRQPATVL